MRGWRRIGVSLLLFGAACTGGGAVHPAPTPRLSTGAGSPSRTTALPSVELRADFSEKPAPWRLVAFVGFGSRSAQLRYVPAREIPTREPASFAVASDGSFWIVDPAKRRVVHLSRQGSFIEARGGYSSASTDMVFVGPRLIVARQAQFGAIDVFEPTGVLIPGVLNEDGLRGYISHMIAVDGWLWADVDTPPPRDGPNGYFRVDLSRAGRLVPVPGLPLGNGRWATVDATETNDIVVTYLDRGRTTIQPFHVDLVDRRGGRDIELQGVVGPGNLLLHDDSVYMYVMISAEEPDGRSVGARYLLRVGGSPMLWERLRQPAGIDDDAQRRHITLGPHGRLYLMVTDHDGVRIYERPL